MWWGPSWCLKRDGKVRRMLDSDLEFSTPWKITSTQRAESANQGKLCPVPIRYKTKMSLLIRTTFTSWIRVNNLPNYLLRTWKEWVNTWNQAAREGTNIKAARRCNISRPCLWLKMSAWVSTNDFSDMSTDKDSCLLSASFFWSTDSFLFDAIMILSWNKKKNMKTTISYSCLGSLQVKSLSVTYQHIELWQQRAWEARSTKRPKAVWTKVTKVTATSVITIVVLSFRIRIACIKKQNLTNSFW